MKIKIFYSKNFVKFNFFFYLNPCLTFCSWRTRGCNLNFVAQHLHCLFYSNLKRIFWNLDEIFMTIENFDDIFAISHEIFLQPQVIFESILRYPPRVLKPASYYRLAHFPFLNSLLWIVFDQNLNFKFLN